MLSYQRVCLAISAHSKHIVASSILFVAKAPGFRLELRWGGITKADSDPNWEYPQSNMGYIYICIYIYIHNICIHNIYIPLNIWHHRLGASQLHGLLQRRSGSEPDLGHYVARMRGFNGNFLGIVNSTEIPFDLWRRSWYLATQHTFFDLWAW